MEAITPLDTDQEYTKWLDTHRLLSYKTALAEQGFEELESLCLMNDEEIGDLATIIKMKLGVWYVIFGISLVWQEDRLQ
jgi:hypothetical protein